jgi:hypothetical protein
MILLASHEAISPLLPHSLRSPMVAGSFFLRSVPPFLNVGWWAGLTWDACLFMGSQARCGHMLLFYFLCRDRLFSSP